MAKQTEARLEQSRCDKWLVVLGREDREDREDPEANKAVDEAGLPREKADRAIPREGPRCD